MQNTNNIYFPPTQTSKQEAQRQKSITKQGEILTAERIVRHTQEGEAIGSQNVKDVTFLRETEPRICFIRQLLENPPRDSASISGNSTELRQYHRTSRHHRIQDSHFFLLMEPSAST